MKRFRWIWLICFLLTVIGFGAYRIYEITTEDTSGPRIYSDQKKLTVSIRDGEDVLLQGLTASDKKDGDVTNSIIVEKMSNLYGDNKRTVTYVAFDSDNHTARMEREITYEDYTSPRFELLGSLRFGTGEEINLYDIVRVTDCIDGDISGKVTVQLDGNINNRTPGTYRVEYSVTNSCGDTVYLPVEIEVYQYKVGMARLELSNYLVYYDGGEPDYGKLLENLVIGSTVIPFEDIDYVSVLDKVVVGRPQSPTGAGEDTNSGSREETMEASRDDVTVQSLVNSDVPGVYPVYLLYDDGTYEGMEVVMVVVEE